MKVRSPRSPPEVGAPPRSRRGRVLANEGKHCLGRRQEPLCSPKGTRTVHSVFNVLSEWLWGRADAMERLGARGGDVEAFTCQPIGPDRLPLGNAWLTFVHVEVKTQIIAVSPS